MFAEGEEEQVIRAAASFVHQGLGTALLVGREDRVHATALEAGIELGEGIEIINARLSTRNTVYTNHLYERLQRRGYLLRDCQRLVNTDRNHFAACMVALGDADAMVTGVTRNFSVALEDVRRVIDPKPGHRVIGVSLVVARGRTVLVADTAVTEMPEAHEIAEIAIEAAGVARRLGYEPRLALLAFSTFGHPQGERSARVIEAVRILDSKRVDFEYDGEMAADVALNPSLADVLSVLPAIGPGQCAGDAGVPFGLDFHQNAARAGRRDRDRTASRGPRPSGADRATRRQRQSDWSTWRRSLPTMSAVNFISVMAGAVPANHVLFPFGIGVGAWHKAKRDDGDRRPSLRKTLSGVIAAIATPIDESGAPELKRAINLARYLLDNGCDGLNVLGTTGEATSFSLDERMAVMSAYKAEGLPLDRLMVGTGAAAVSDAVALTCHAAELGFAGALVLPPFYYKGVPDDELVAYIDTLVQATVGQADTDLSLSFPGDVGIAVACRADQTAVGFVSDPHRGPQGFLRRYGLRPLGGGSRARLRGVSFDRSRAHRRARRRVRRLHLGHRQSQCRSVCARMARRRCWRARRRGCDPQAVRRQAAGFRREGAARAYS